MSRAGLEVADIVRLHGADFVAARRGRVAAAERRVLRAISECRTPALGGHVDRCDECGHQEISYNSCRNRHCPKCQASARNRWAAEREVDLLPVEYFHVVFTLPKEITGLAMQNKRAVYTILFQASAETLREVAADPKHLGCKIGLLSVLHTWGQNLQLHPHVHCVVPGGGLSPDGRRWVPCRPGFLLPVRVLSKVYRGKFLQALKRVYAEGKLKLEGQLEHLMNPEAFKAHVEPLYGRNWVVYSKRPFGGPTQVLKYLSRYTHQWPSRTVGWSESKTVESRSSGKTMRTAVDGGSSRSVPSSSFDAFFSTSCRRDSSESDTMASLRTAAGGRRSSSAASSLQSGRRLTHQSLTTAARPRTSVETPSYAPRASAGE